MLLNSARAVVLVDKINDVLNLSDIRSISYTEDTEECLKISCTNFLKMHVPNRKDKAISCAHDASYDILSLMVKHNVHNVFVASGLVREHHKRIIRVIPDVEHMLGC